MEKVISPGITFHEEQLSLPSEDIERARAELMPFPQLLDDISSELLRSALRLQAFKDYPGDVWPGLDSLRAQVSSLQQEKEDLAGKCGSAESELAQARETIKALENRAKKDAKDAARKMQIELQAARDDAEKERALIVAEVERKLAESFEEQLQMSKKKMVEEYKRSPYFKSLMMKSLLSGRDMTATILKHCFQGLETSFLDDFGSLVKGGAYKHLPVIEIPAYPEFDVKALLASAEFAAKEANSSKDATKKKAPEHSPRSSRKSTPSASTPAQEADNAPKSSSLGPADA